MIPAERAATPSGAGGSETGRLITPMDRVLRALNHPLRRRILRALLLDGEQSATSLSRELKVHLGLISYHLNLVLAQECEVVEVTKVVPRRGATEKFYRLKFRSLAESDSAPGADAPGGGRAMSFEECLIAAVAAMEANAFEVEGGSWNWFSAQVDTEAWSEICAAGEDFAQRARAAIDSSRTRAGGEEIRAAVVGAAAFPAASPPPAS